MNTPGLMLSPSMTGGFKFVIMDVNYTEGDRVIELNAPEDLYSIATLLRDPERYVVESIWSRVTGDQAAAVSPMSELEYTGTVEQLKLLDKRFKVRA